MTYVKVPRHVGVAETVARHLHATVGPSRTPPGPPNSRHGAGHITRLRDDFLGYVTQLQYQYGHCVHYRVGMTPVYQFTHPDQIQEILVTKARSFRKTDRLQAVLGRWLGGGLLVNEGEAWAAQRRLVQPYFQPQRLPLYAGAIVRRSREWIDRSVEREFDLVPELNRLTLLTIGEVLFGADLSDVAENFIEKVAAMQAIAYADFTARLGRKSSRRFDTDQRIREVIEFLDALVSKIVAGRRRSAHRPDDLLSALLGTDADQPDGATVPRRIRDEIIMLLLAGNATTSAAITWVAYALAKNAHVQDRAAIEVVRVLGGRTATAADLNSLKLTEHAILESWRLYPPAFTLSRQAIEPVEIGDYRLPAGAQLHLIPYLTHRDPRWFDTPSEYRPERFAADAELQIPRFAFIPFGAGPRACVGGGLAMLTAHLVIATILQHCRVELAAGQGEPRLQPLISLHPQGGIRVRFSSRGESTSVHSNSRIG